MGEPDMPAAAGGGLAVAPTPAANLTAVSPGGGGGSAKKLKQARLPFAPLNKTPKSESDKKRKLSDSTEQAEPKKQVKLAFESQSTTNDKSKESGNENVLKADIKSKLESFACKSNTDASTAEESKENKIEEKENEKTVTKPREVKPKKAKKSVEKVVVIDEDSLQARPDNMKGRVKLPFKKKGRKSEEKKDEDSDVEILDEISITPGDEASTANEENKESPADVSGKGDSEAQNKASTDKDATETDKKPADKGKAPKSSEPKEKKGKKKKEAEASAETGRGDDTSMTDEWAEFHQKEMEKNPVEAPNAAIEKLVTPKGEKKKSVVKKATPPPSSADKKVASDGPSSESKEESKSEAPKPKPAPKVNPLAKFLVKMPPGSIPPPKKPVAKSPTPSVSPKESLAATTETLEAKRKADILASMKDKLSTEADKGDEKIVDDKKDDKLVDDKNDDKQVNDGEVVVVEDMDVDDKASEEKKTAEIDPKDQETKEKTESKNEPNLLITPKPAGSVSKLAATPSNPEAKPVTPASVRSQQMAVAKLKVTVQEAIIKMEEAVEKEEFLQAHELKQKIANLEAEIEKIQADKNFVSFSPTTQNIVASLTSSSTSSTPVASTSSTPVAKPSNKQPSSNASTPGVSTPSSANVSTSGNVMTPSNADPSKTPKSSQTKKPRAKKVTTPGSANTSLTATSAATTPKALTPKQQALADERRKKQLALSEEKERKRKEREMVKQDKDRQKEIDKRMKEIERLDKERQRREKEREKEKEKKEREEERVRKKEEKEAELKKKEEEKAKVDEAKRLKEEALKKEEELKAEKQRKAAAAFKGFFVKKDTTKDVVDTTEESKKKEAESEGQQFNPFQVKKDMRLAPLTRADPQAAKKSLDSLEGPSGPSDLYLELLKGGRTVPAKQGKTWPWTKADSDEVEILEDEDDYEEDCEGEDGVMILRAGDGKQQHRAKLLQFHENQRPAYWGTWRKKSRLVNGRKPFGQDGVHFDYEYDSDEDWEDEGEGESLSDAEDEKEEEDEYEVDNEFFVPHGYLSDGEEDKDDDEVFNPELEKEKLKLKEKEFEKEIKKKTQQLKPRLWGCYWEPLEQLNTETAAQQLVRVLSGYAAIPCCNNNAPIPTAISHPQSSPAIPVGEDVTESAKAKVKAAKVPKTFPAEALPDLVRLTHMNINNKIFLAKEFIQFWSGKCIEKPTDVNVQESSETPAGTEGSTTPGPSTPSTSGMLISKKKVVDKIKEIADYKMVDSRSGRLWVVKPEILAQVKHEETETNTWSYILEQPNKQTTDDIIGTSGIVNGVSGSSRPPSPVQSKSSSPNPAQLITKFTKVLSEDERARLNTTPPNAKRQKFNNGEGTASAEGQNSGNQSPAGVNMIPVKRGPANNGGVNKIAVKRKSTAGKSPANNKPVNMIAVKRASSGGGSSAIGGLPPPVRNNKSATSSPSAAAINKITAKKRPQNTNAAASGNMPSPLSRLPAGVSVTKVVSNDDDDCITIE